MRNDKRFLTITLFCLMAFCTFCFAQERESVSGDVNDDGIVNVQDLVLVAAAIGETGETDADVNSDGIVNIQDLVLVAAAIGEIPPPPTFSASVPLYSVLEGQTWSLDLSTIFTDATLYSFQSEYTPPEYLTLSGSILSITTAPQVDSDTIIEMLVTGINAIGRTNGTITLFINNVLPAPTFTAPPPQTMKESGYSESGSGWTLDIKPLFVNATSYMLVSAPRYILLDSAFILRSKTKRLSDNQGLPNVTFGNTITVNIVVSATNLGGTTQATIPLTITPHDLRPELQYNLDAIPTQYSAEDRTFTAFLFSWVRHSLVGIADPTIAFQDDYTVPSFISLGTSSRGNPYLRAKLPKITTQTTYNIKLKATNEDGDLNFTYPLVALPIPDGVTHTGNFTRVGNAQYFGANVWSVDLAAFGPTLYMLGVVRGLEPYSVNLYTVNPTTGVATKVGDVTNLNLPLNHTPLSIGFLGSTLYGVVRYKTRYSYLVTINTSTGVASRVNTTNSLTKRFKSLFALDGTLYGFYEVFDEIYAINTSTGLSSRVYEDFYRGFYDINSFTTIGNTVFAAGQHHIKLVDFDIQKALMIGNHRVDFWSLEQITGLASIGNTLYLCKSWDGKDHALYSSAAP